MFIAALDQHVGDGFAQLQALGNGKQMILTLGAGVFHQIGVAQPLGMDQHRAGHHDFVVEGELAHDLGRRVFHGRQPVRQSGAGLDLDFDHQPLQHVVEQRDLLARIAA